MIDPVINRRNLLAAAAGAPIIGQAKFVDEAAQLLPRSSWADPLLMLPLATDMRAHGSSVAAVVDGPYRFVSIAGKRGYQALGLKTSLKIPSDQHIRDVGTILFSLSPLESLGVSPPLQYVAQKDPHWHDYGLFADVPRTNSIEAAIFAWYWRNDWHPAMIAKFKSGRAGAAAADYAVTPYVPVEHLPLVEREWYQLAFTWNKPESRFCIYVNGILCGKTRFPFKSDQPHADLYAGNSAMAFADIAIFGEELSGPEIAARYSASDLPKNPAVAKELADLFIATPKPAVDWRPASPWQLQYERGLTRSGDFAGWRQQGCLKPPFELTAFETTPEGLLIETPEQVDTESRVYFWSPDSFEGDVAVEFAFRPEKDTGLALLVVQASGMQREDFLTDHPPRTSGSMSTIITDRVRNYHWEFYRQAVDVRTDLGTQVLIKNPWLKPLGMSCLPPLAVGEWHRLLFVQEGSRLRAAIDGRWALDVTDDPFSHSGPVLSAGRIGLRLMYATRMRFRDLKVWNRPRSSPAHHSA